MYNSIVLITYADEKYKAHQRALSQRVRDVGLTETIFEYSDEWLKGRSFYRENQNILSQARGSGYWLWKPYIILETLKDMNEDYILVYMDCGDWLVGNPGHFLKEKMASVDILLTLGNWENRFYTKRDCFIMMDCDSKRYWDTVQAEAGIIVCKKTEPTLSFINQWLIHCLNEYMITDLPNICGKENFPEFIDHRHDQSILTNMKEKYGIECTKEMFDFVTCNYKTV